MTVPLGVAIARDLGAAMDVAERISALSASIQALPPRLRWAAASESSIAAQATDGSSGEGPRGRVVFRALAVADRMHAAVPLVRAMALTRMRHIWRCQQAGTVGPVPAQPIFFGIRALNERTSLPRYEQRVDGAAVYVDQRREACLAHVVRPGWRALRRAWCDAVDPVLDWVRAGDTPLPAPAILTGIVRRGPEFAYLLAGLRELATSGVRGPLGFSTADLPAHAAVVAGLPAVFYQHGFLRRSLVFPDFGEIVALNHPEAAYLAARLPHARVTVAPPPAAPDVLAAGLEPARKLVVVGDYVEQDCGPARQLIERCLSAGIEVVARPHPADARGIWSGWGDIAGVVIDRTGTFAECLERHRPAAVAAWYSTALYDAVLAGVSPVTFESRFVDVVFPFQRMALAWPRQTDRVMALFEGRAARMSAVAAARRFAFGVPA